MFLIGFERKFVIKIYENDDWLPTVTFRVFFPIFRMLFSNFNKRTLEAILSACHRQIGKKEQRERAKKKSNRTNCFFFAKLKPFIRCLEISFRKLRLDFPRISNWIWRGNFLSVVILCCFLFRSSNNRI